MQGPWVRGGELAAAVGGGHGTCDATVLLAAGLDPSVQDLAAASGGHSTSDATAVLLAAGLDPSVQDLERYLSVCVCVPVPVYMPVCV